MNREKDIDMDKKQAAEILGKAGGLATKKKYGKKHYQKLADNMNRKIKAKSKHHDKK